MWIKDWTFSSFSKNQIYLSNSFIDESLIIEPTKAKKETLSCKYLIGLAKVILDWKRIESQFDCQWSFVNHGSIIQGMPLICVKQQQVHKRNDY